ncbi:MAG TPA: amino acid ABC transporter substrate-binding protein [Gammaproteobacteria bacterium]|nr:amino acid ABC transporter substrate-binding protein [Gammaproteobacteria bacterium]
MLSLHRSIMLGAALLAITVATGCSTERKTIEKLTDLAGAEFAVPTGTVADQLVQSVISDAKFQYYNSVLDSAMAVKAGRADAAAYDEPILRNIAARNPGLIVLPDRITIDEYGFAVRLDDADLKAAIDAEVGELRANGGYDEMLSRWLPDVGEPAAMPEIPEGSGEVLRFGTAAVTEPFSFYDGEREVVGFDIEIARRVAARLGRRLEIVDMEFGSMIPALIAGKVDFIGACITITEERAKSVLFSNSYYTGGISALVRGSADGAEM